MRKTVLSGLAACGLLFIGACSNPPKSASSDDKTDADAKVAAPTGPVPAKTAYWEMYTAARRDWSTDLMPLTVEAKEIPGVASEDGKAALWNVTFVSASKKEARVYSYAIAAHPPDIYKGVTVGKPLPWNGNRDFTPFTMGQVQIDSDQAYKSASMDASAWLKQHAGEKVTAVTLKHFAKYQLPIWSVVWGNDKVGYRAFISGIDGKPMPK